MSCEEPRVRQVGVFTDCTCHLPGVVRFITGPRLLHRRAPRRRRRATQAD